MTGLRVDGDIQTIIEITSDDNIRREFKGDIRGKTLREENGVYLREWKQIQQDVRWCATARQHLIDLTRLVQSFSEGTPSPDHVAEVLQAAQYSIRVSKWS